MSSFSPKVYQQQVLESVEAYFKACQVSPSPAVAFAAVTEHLWNRTLPSSSLGLKTVIQAAEITEHTENARYAWSFFLTPMG